VDKPHFQLPDWGSTTDRLKILYGTPERFRKTWKEETMKEERYNTINEVPEWGRAAVQRLIDKGCFADTKALDLSKDMVRTFVILERSK